MKRLYSAFSYRNSIILVSSIFILFFLIVSGLPSSSNPMISTTAVEANAEPAANPVPSGSIRRAIAASPFFAPNITATKVDSIFTDVDSDGKADPGDTLMYTITISNTGIDPATGVNFNDTIDANTTLVPGSVAASPIAVNDSYNTIGNVNIQVPAPGVIANDLNPNVNPSTNTAALVVTQVNATAVPGGGSATASTANGSVTLSSDGSFTYTPNAGFRGPSDTFTYTLGNTTGKTDTATVTINVSGMIWFVNNDPAAPGTAPGDGRLNNPFRQLAGPNSFDTLAADQAGDNIFIYTGTAAYTGGLTLLNTQKIIGQGAPSTLLAITGYTAPSGTNLLPSTNGADPVITTSGTTAITLGQNNQLHGFTVGNTGAAGTDIAGTNFGTTPGLTVVDVTLNGTGQALNLMTGTIVSGSTFATIESTGGSPAEGIRLNTVGGAFTVTTTNIVSPTGTGIDVQSSPTGTNFNFGSTTVNKGNAGTGINLASNNSSSTITFTSLALTTTNGSGLVANTNGTVNVTTGSITSTGGPALNVSSTAAGMVFTTVSSTNSTTTGINLATVTGSLGITTTTITNPTGIGISETSSSATVNYGTTTVNGSGGTGVVLGTTGNGNTGTITFGALNIAPDAGQRALLAQDNTSTITATSGALSASSAVTVEITRSSSTTPLAISLTSVSANGAASGIILSNTSGSFAIVGDAGSSNNSSGGTIQNNTSHGISLATASNISLDQMNIQSSGGSGINGTGVTNFSFTNGTINNSGNALGESNIAFNGNGTLAGNNINGTFTVTNSTLTNAFDHGIHTESNAGTISNAIIQNNTITSTTSTATSKGTGIQIIGTGTATTSASLTKATISSNTVRNFPTGSGIQVSYSNANTTGPGATAGIPNDATNIISITGNTVRGENATSRIGTSAILAILSGGNSASRTQGNFDVSNNGTVAQPIGDCLGIVLGVGCNGFSTMTATANNNVIVGHNTVGSAGLSGAAGVSIGCVGGRCESPDMTMTANGNNISQTDGNGILMVVRDTTGFGKFTIKNNTVAAPLGGTRPGIRVDAGNGVSATADDAVCVDIQSNTTAGSGTGGIIAAGIGLRKQGTNPTVHDFGVEGMAATSTPGVENYVGGLNPGSADGVADGSVNGVLLISATSGFTNCNSAPRPAGARETEAQAVREGSSQDLQDVLSLPHPAAKPDDTLRKLTQAEVDFIVLGALERWRLAGISGDDLVRLQNVKFEVAALTGTQIAAATADTVKISELAGNFGWFVDQSPWEDSEFSVGVPGRELQTTEQSIAHGRMDLLTVVMHELGKEYLKGNKEIPQALQPLMDTTIGLAVRRLPDASKIDFIIPAMPDIYIPPMVDATVPVLAPGSSATSAAQAGVEPQGAAGTLAPQSGETVSLPLGTIPPGESVTIMFRATINALGTLPVGTTQVCNQGTVSGSNFANVLTDDPDVAGANQPTCTQLDVADLAVTKTDSPDPVVAGQNITYTITVTNNGPQAAASATLTDAIPANTTFVSVTTPAGWTRTDSVPVGGTGNITFTNPSVANAASAVFTLVVQVGANTPDATVISNTATVAATTSDTTPANNTATATTTVTRRADLAVTKTDSPDPVQAGNNITYTINFVNNGPNTADSTTVTDAVPANTTFVSATVMTGTGWSTSAPSVGGTGNVVFSKASVANGETAVFIIVVKVSDTAANGSTISNSVTAASTTVDGTPGNNTATATTTVTRQADLAVTKSDSPDPAFAGNNITYTIGFTNNGPNIADTVTVTDAVPANTTFVSATVTTGTGWSTSAPSVGGTGNVVFSKASVANGETATFTIVVQINASTPNGTTITNTATAASTTPDPTPGNNSATATTTANQQADLSITKSDSPDPVFAGNNITYTINLSNGGPGTASTVTVTDAVPANTTFVSATVTTGSGWSTSAPAVGGTGNVVFSKASVANAETATFTIVVKVASSVASGTVISNTATAASTTADPTPANNTATATTTVATQADVSITKSDSPDPVFAGNNLTYTITVTNNGPSDASTVNWTDTLPAGTTFVSLSTVAGWTNVSVPPVGGGGVVSVSNPSFAPGSAVFTLVVKVGSNVASGTVLSNTASVTTTTTDPTPGNNSATATTTVATQVDLAVTKSDSPDPVVAGQNITYTIGFTSGGPSDAQTVTVTDAVPANTTFVSATVTTGTGWSTAAPAVGGTGNVVFSKATTTAGEVATFTIVVKVNSSTANGSIISNTVTAATVTTDTTPGNNSATATTTVQASADLAVTKTDTPDPAFAGGNITYTISFTNNGPSDAQTVNVTDATPANTTFVSATVTTGTGWSTSAPAVGGTGNVMFSKATVAAGETATFTIVVKVNSSTANGTVITNTATTASTTTDPTPGNNSATATTTIQAQADIAITKSDSPDPVVAGQNITYTVTYTQNGPSDALTVAITDATPANTTFVSATVTTGTGWSTAAPAVGGTGNVVFSKATSTPGDTATFTIVVKVNANTANGATISNTATATTASVDPTPGNNTASATTAVVTQADLAVTKSDSPDPVTAGNNLTYTITFTNNGSSDAQTVTLTDAVPANTTFISAAVNTGTGWSTAAPAVGGTGNVVFSKGTVAAGETASFTIVVKVNANTANAATITNSVVAASATTDPTPGNNTATATTTVQTRADLAVTKTDSPDPVSAGGNLTYTITYVNNGASDAQTVTLTDAVPANTTFVSATVTTGTGWSTAAPAVGGTGNVVFSKGTSPVGETATFTIVVKVNSNVASGSTITNVVTAASATTDPTPGNNTATATTTTNTMADISVTKTDSPDPVVATQNLTYTITLTNNGASDAQTVTVTDAIPANTTFVSSTAPKGWGTMAPAVGGTGNVVFSKATVPAGEVAVFTIVVNVNGSTPNNTVITNSATGATATTDPNPGNNTGTATTTVIAQADLAVTKSDSPDPVCVGANITYSIGLTNNGPGPGINTTVTDATPANTTFVSATAPSGWTVTAPAVGGTGNIVFSKANVANGETAAFTIVVKVNNGTVHGTVINNTVTAASTIPDPTPGNNTAMAQTTVDPIPPTITCPANVIVAIPGTGSCTVVNYPAPTVSDNCSASVVCTPPSGTCFPAGTTTVTCTATDTAGNTAMCSFSVTVYDICIQDDSNPGTVILINSTTGDYRFCCSGTTYTGTGTIKVKGATTTLEDFNATRRVSAKVDKSTFIGTGYIQQPPGSNLCTITDRDIRNNSCNCQ